VEDLLSFSGAIPVGIGPAQSLPGGSGDDAHGGPLLSLLLLDRTPVVLRKQMTTKPKSELALAQAKAKGQVETVSRAGQPSSSASAAARLDDNEAADFHQEKVITLEFKLALQKARQAKGLTQGDLAKLINVTQKVIQDYESGKAVPIGNIINLLNRKLETVLPKMSVGQEKQQAREIWPDGGRSFKPI
jgi:putative transcription factor